MQPKRMIGMVEWAKSNSKVRAEGKSGPQWVKIRNEWADDRRTVNVLLNTLAFGVASQKMDPGLTAWLMVAKAPPCYLEATDGPSGWRVVADVLAKAIKNGRERVLP